MKAFVLFGICLTFASFASNADELLVTSGAAKAKVGHTYAIDFMSSGEAVALQFNIKIPKGVRDSQIDLSACVADLPKSHAGQCKVAKGHIVGLVYSDTNEALPAGLVSVGRISMNASLVKNQQKLQFTEFLVSNSKAQPVESTVTVAD